MANYRAVAATCQAVLHLLRINHRPGDFDQEMEFKVHLAKDFMQPMSAGVSLFLYRIAPDGTYRTPPGRIGSDGRRRKSQLPLNLYFLLTAWGKDSSLQHAIAGWMMRMIEDTPSLPAGLLNAVSPGVFRPDETVELVLTELTNEDMFRIWEGVVQNVYQISVPYVARVVTLESNVPAAAEAPPVQQRDVDYWPAGAGRS